MLIKCRVPGIDVAFHPCHPAPTFPIKYLTSNMHEHHQCRFGHTVPATGLLPDITQRIVQPDCPFKHEGMARVVTPGCRHHLQSVWVGALCILNAFCRGKLPPVGDYLTHSPPSILPCKYMEIPYNVLLFQRKKAWLSAAGSSTRWANTALVYEIIAELQWHPFLEEHWGKKKKKKNRKQLAWHVGLHC